MNQLSDAWVPKVEEFLKELRARLQKVNPDMSVIRESDHGIVQIWDGLRLASSWILFEDQTRTICYQQVQVQTS